MEKTNSARGISHNGKEKAAVAASCAMEWPHTGRAKQGFSNRECRGCIPSSVCTPVPDLSEWGIEFYIDKGTMKQSQRRRPRSTRSNTEELGECNPRVKSMPKSQTFTNGQKVSQPHLVNEKHYTDNPRQPARAGNICPMKALKKQSSAGGCHGEKLRTNNLVISNGLDDSPGTSGTDAQHVPRHVSDRSPGENATCSPPPERQSLEKLFLDLELVDLTKEDEDSASDLSDSERIPIPPSPLTPPDLNLRAEEISPGYFSHRVQAKDKDYGYPDFLPPPYNAWSLSEASTLLNKEGKNPLHAAPSAFLERYIERLLQMEWLQSQTVQAEKTKTNKSRPQTASGLCRNGKFLGKSKSWHSPSPSKPSPDNPSKMALAQERSSHRKYPNRQNSDLTCACKSPTKVSGSMNAPVSMFRQSQVIRTVPKKTSAMNSQQTRDVALLSCAKMYSTGNLRPPTQSSVPIYSASPPKQKCSKLKKINGQSTTDTEHGRAKRNGKPSQSPSYKSK